MYNLLLSYILSLSTLSYIGNCLLKKRYHYILLQVLIFVICVSCIFLLLFYHGVEISSYGTYTISISLLVYLLLVYNDKIIKKFIIFIFFILDDSISEVMSTMSLNLALSFNTKTFFYTIRYTFAVIVSFLFLLALAVMFIKLVKKSNWEMFPKYIYVIFVLPISTILLIFRLRNYLYLFKNDYIFIVILLGLIISNYIIIYLLLKIMNNMKIKVEINKIKNEKKLLDLKCDMINTQYNANFYFLHDLIRRFRKVQTCLYLKDYATFNIEMLKLNDKMLKEFNMIISNSTIRSPLLYYRHNDFIKNSIEFKSVIEYSDFSFLDINTQRSLFNLLIDIAIKQCEKRKDKENVIILKTKKIQDNIVIQILFTHNESFKDIISNLSVLKFLLKEINCKISFRDLYNADSDSLIIMISLYMR